MRHPQGAPRRAFFSDARLTLALSVSAALHLALALTPWYQRIAEIKAVGSPLVARLVSVHPANDRKSAEVPIPAPLETPRYQVEPPESPPLARPPALPHDAPPAEQAAPVKAETIQGFALPSAAPTLIQGTSSYWRRPRATPDSRPYREMAEQRAISEAERQGMEARRIWFAALANQASKLTLRGVCTLHWPDTGGPAAPQCEHPADHETATRFAAAAGTPPTWPGAPFAVLLHPLPEGLGVAANPIQTKGSGE